MKMKFKEYLTELKSANQEMIVNYLEDIKKFISQSGLDLIDNENGILFRGMRGMNGNDVEVVDVRNDRLPKNTSRIMHKTADDFFNDKFGTKYRSGSVFSTKSYKMAKDYGKPYVIIPIGDYTFCYSDTVDDLFNDFIGGFTKRWFRNGPIDNMSLSELNDILEQNGYPTTTEEEITAVKNHKLTGTVALPSDAFKMLQDDFDDMESSPESKDRVTGFVYDCLYYAGYKESKTIDSNVDNLAEIMIKCDKYLAILYESPSYEFLKKALNEKN